MYNYLPGSTFNFVPSFQIVNNPEQQCFEIFNLKLLIMLDVCMSVKHIREVHPLALKIISDFRKCQNSVNILLVSI